MTLYELLDMKGKSIMKSYVVREMTNDSHANIHIEIEAYDDTFINARERKGIDYIFEQLEKKLTQEKVRDRIVDVLGLESFKGALVTLYDIRVHEMYFRENGVNQYDIKW